MMWGSSGSAAWLWLVLGLLVAVAAGVVALMLSGRRPDTPNGAGSAVEILKHRFARGEIDEAEYGEALTVLRAGSPAPSRRSGWANAPMLSAAVVAVLLIAFVAVAAIAAGRLTAPFRSFAAPTCTAPVLPGQPVDVALSDMGGMMGGGMMGGRYFPGSMMGPGMRMWRVAASPSTVSAGEVSLRVWNAGSIVHELVALPLSSGGAGSKPVGSDGTVSEDGSLGEASASCAEGAGEGIAPGAVGWVTLHLAAGRYELVCNLPGHYAAGMFTEFDVR